MKVLAVVRWDDFFPYLLFQSPSLLSSAPTSVWIFLSTCRSSRRSPLLGESAGARACRSWWGHSPEAVCVCVCHTVTLDTLADLSTQHFNLTRVIRCWYYIWFVGTNTFILLYCIIFRNYCAHIDKKQFSRAPQSSCVLIIRATMKTWMWFLSLE